MNIQQNSSGAVTFDVVDDSAANGLISVGSKGIATRANNSYQIYGYDATQLHVRIDTKEFEAKGYGNIKVTQK